MTGNTYAPINKIIGAEKISNIFIAHGVTYTVGKQLHAKLSACVFRIINTLVVVFITVIMCI